MTLSFTPVSGIGEVRPGDNIAELIAGLTELIDGDVVVVTSKIVSKAAGLTTRADKDELLAAETDRVVATRGGTRIVRTHHGLTMAAAGIDASNTAPGTLVPLPPDPDGSALEIRTALRKLTGLSIAVIISDTAGRAWRVGQTDIAIGCAGIMPFESFAGRTDPYGNPLIVTVPAIADQIAGAAELTSGKFGGNPAVVVRGVDPAWLLDDDGPGAAALIRDETEDLFGLGARDAVIAAVTHSGMVRGFPHIPDTTIADLLELANSEGLDATASETTVTIRIGSEPDELVAAGALKQRLETLATAHNLPITTSLTR